MVDRSQPARTRDRTVRSHTQISTADSTHGSLFAMSVFSVLGLVAERENKRERSVLYPDLVFRDWTKLDDERPPGLCGRDDNLPRCRLCGCSPSWSHHRAHSNSLITRRAELHSAPCRSPYRPEPIRTLTTIVATVRRAFSTTSTTNPCPTLSNLTAWAKDTLRLPRKHPSRQRHQRGMQALEPRPRWRPQQRRRRPVGCRRG